MSLTCPQGKPALIYGKHRAPVPDLPLLLLYGKCQSDSTVSGSEQRVNWPSGHPHEVCFWFFCFFLLEIFTRVAYWRSFCSFDGGHLVPPCTKVQILVMMGEAFSTSLSSSPGVTAGLLESPPWYQDRAARHRKPDNGVYWCIILAELDYLFKHSLPKHIQDDSCSWSLSLHIFEEGQTPVYRIL